MINLQNKASKGRSGGIIWMNKDLKSALIEYRKLYPHMNAHDTLIRTERHKRTSPQVIVNMFANWYHKLGFEGCSSHTAEIKQKISRMVR